MWTALALSPVVLALWIALDGSPAVLPVLSVVLPFGVIRRRPLGALGVLLAETVLVHLVPLPGFQSGILVLQIAAADLAIGCLAAARGLRVSLGVGIVTLAVHLTVAAVFGLWPSALHAVLVALVLIVAWLTGNTIRLRRRYRQARQAQAEAQVVQAERLRIARELHDMVAHSIGVIAIQAGMGSRVIHTQPAEASEALRAIEAAGRDTLAGLRRMIGALRRSDGEPVAAQHGLGDLDDLVARSLGAGVSVDVQWRGERRPLPPDIDLSAFRIIQEAVTNVVRHAGTDRCEVVLDQRDEELLIEVTDNGRGGAPSAGYGLRGMRERVALLRGEFTAEPRPEGGFRVTARIPIPAGVR
ncbi:sensor histidine kinase [Amycolatopsis anabasis]|uniref:sensor histidine kinase n=1 Tax=Amycolatopsis anabasis TaxID=1840409 RepID=UPI001C551BC1|nr:sensor histidine kinase [Amycolatopsis anabasis]